MTRRMKWQMEASDAVSWHQDQALNATIFLLRETGPTSFLLKEEGEENRIKVSLGDPHSCTCSVFKREKNPCKHICWVILKRFKWPKSHELSYQHGLVEREINQLLNGPRRPRPENPEKPKSSKGTSGEGALQQRAISKVDVCPICQEELLTKHTPVTYCKFGCGNSIHIKCMKVWAEHQRRSNVDDNIKCPICRASFGSFYSLLEELRNSSEGDETYHLNVHFSTSCGICNMCPIKGKCYKCSTCASFFLCNACFHSNKHRQHSFEFRVNRTHRWRPAKTRNQQDPALEIAILNDLSSRDITEDDYELLLQLDRNENESQSTTSVDLSGLPFHVINSLPLMKVRHGGKLLAPGKQCRLCLRTYEIGQYVRKLPECKHIFHRDCIDKWLSEDHRRCPIDRKLVGMHRKVTPSDAEQAAEEEGIFLTSQGDAGQLIVPGIGIARLQQSPMAHNRRSSVYNQHETRRVRSQNPARRPISNESSGILISDMLSNIDSVASRASDSRRNTPGISHGTTNRSRRGIEKGLVARRMSGQQSQNSRNLTYDLGLWLDGNPVLRNNSNGN